MKPRIGLCRLPLLRQAMRDPAVRIVTRAIDKNWTYEGYLRVSVSGFNPYLRSVFIARDSAIADWLDAGARDDRKYNAGDFLAQEALFLVHDYLHCWATAVIQADFPRLRFGYGKIDRRSLDDFAFCHLLTEAAATVGLDYWYLSTVDFSEILPGSNLRTLTVSYHENDLPEYRAISPRYRVQSPDFFGKIARFYCTGDFPDFSPGDLRRSPRLLRWLRHELDYGETQRRYTRNWLIHLSNRLPGISRERASAPVRIDRRWQRELIDHLGQELWKKVKTDELRKFSGLPPPSRAWRRDARLAPDFRFTNLNRMDRKRFAELSTRLDLDENRSYAFFQALSKYPYDAFPSGLRPIISLLREKGDFVTLETLCRRLRIKPLRPGISEPADLFFLN